MPATPRRRRIWEGRLVPASLCFLVLGLSGAQAAVTVTGAWSRASLPHQTEGVAYLTLRSSDGDVLTGADAAEAGMAMLHQAVRTAPGTMSMKDVDSLALPAGQSVALAPNGTHIMLMDLKHSLKPGDTVHLTLHFARSGDQTIDVPVRPWKN
jgi:copper(I)-binding protein